MTSTTKKDLPERRISSYGYGILKSKLTAIECEALKKKLTVTPITVPGYGDDEGKSFPCFRENNTRIYVPKMFGINEFGAADSVVLSDGDDIDVKFEGSLRPHQQAALEACEQKIFSKHDTCGGGLLVLPCGFGKTVCALYAIAHVKKKTLIIVHKNFLLKQWEERIQQYMPNARVGFIKASVCDVENKDIVIGSLQSISMKEYEDNVFESFGFVIVDEVHHIGAAVFSRALHKVNFRYSLGLSATPTRKDGLTKVIKWFMGNVIFSTKREASSRVVVETCKFQCFDPLYSQTISLFNGKPNLARMTNHICEYEPRIQYIVNKIVEKRSLHKQHAHIIVLSDRLNQLDKICNELKSRNLDPPPTIGFYIGKQKQEKLQHIGETCDVILGTYALCSEGFDIPRLNILILASPKSDVEQSVGRIQRKEVCYDANAPETMEPPPTVIDMIDSFSAFENMSKKREKFYKKNGYEVREEVYKHSS